MSRPRIAIPIMVQFSIRYAIRTGLVSRFKEFCEPIVLLRWEDADLIHELHNQDIEVVILPRQQCGIWYYRLKRQLDFWHLRRLRSPSVAIDARRRRAITPPSLRQVLSDSLYSTAALVPGWPAAVRRELNEVVWKDTNIQQFVQCLEDVKADAVLSLTPYFQQEQILLFAAKALGLRLCASILSFDNITTRGWIPVIFDAYFLWNKYNVDELRRAYPESRSRPVKIIGAPQFDFYWDATYLWDETEWRNQLGIPSSRPIILFGAGYYLIAPQEPVWLQQLDEAIESGEIPEKPIILFRRHPNDPLERWLPTLRKAKHIVVDDPWRLGQEDLALTNIRREDIEKLASTLAFSQVHVNASSTMTVDGAIFDRPQIGPAYDDQPGRRYDRIIKELYLREHYLPITRSGGLSIAYSRAELIHAVRDAFTNPERLSEGRRKIVQEICTFDDGRCTERLCQAVNTFLTTPGAFLSD